MDPPNLPRFLLPLIPLTGEPGGPGAALPVQEDPRDAEIVHLRAVLVEAAECLRLIDTDPRVGVDSEALRTRVHQARIKSHAACYATQSR